MPAHRTGAARAAGPHRRPRQDFVTTEVMISQRPLRPTDRAVPGHWEGDLIIGLSQLGDRHPGRTHHPVHHAAAPAPHGRARQQPRVKNGPALAGHGAEAVRDAIAATITTLPEQLRRSLTWDQGAEMAQHAQLTHRHRPARSTSATRTAPGSAARTRTPTACCASTSPKAPTSARHSADDLAAVAAALNSRPRKTLGWRTPAEALNDHLLSIQTGGVATTP